MKNDEVGTCTSHPIFLRKPKRSVCLQKTRHLDYATYPRENVSTEQYHGDKTKLPSPFFQDTLSWVAIGYWSANPVLLCTFIVNFLSKFADDS